MVHSDLLMLILPRPPPTEPRSTVTALDHLPALAQKAERERAQIRANSRRVLELQDKMNDLKARLELEMRARKAAEERAELAYDQGYRYGVQVMQSQAWLNPMIFPQRPHFQLPAQQMSVGPMMMPITPASMRSAAQGSMQAAPTAADPATRAPVPQMTGLPTLAPNDPPAPKRATAQRPSGAVSGASSPAPPAPRAPAPGSTDPRIAALRERALATTAAFRNRQVAQSADQWLEENQHLLAAGEKRKREEDAGEGKQDENEG